MKKLFLYLYFLSAFTHYTYAGDSYLFDIEKEGLSIHVYGTYHGTALHALPEKIQSIILSHNILITESTGHSEPLTYAVCKNMGFLCQGECYFELLNDNEKNELRKYIDPFLQKKHAEIKIEDLNLKGLYQAYIAGHFIKGMDYTLLDFFKNKTVLGLESLNSISQFFEEPSLEELRGALAVKCGFESEEAEQDEIAYLDGSLLRPSDDLEISTRNDRALERIAQYHKRYGSAAIICVGVGHIHDLLVKLSERGFNIRRANNEGIFSPYKIM